MTRAEDGRETWAEDGRWRPSLGPRLVAVRALIGVGDVTWDQAQFHRSTFSYRGYLPQKEEFFGAPHSAECSMNT